MDQDALGELRTGFEGYLIGCESGFADTRSDYLGAILGFVLLWLHDVTIDVGDIIEIHLIRQRDFFYLLTRDQLLEIDDGRVDEVLIRRRRFNALLFDV